MDRTASLARKALHVRAAKLLLGAVLCLFAALGALACAPTAQTEEGESVVQGENAAEGEGSGENAEGASAEAADAAIAADTANMDFEYSKRDLDAGYSEADACAIVFSESGAEVKGSGASADGGSVSISDEGCYILSGSCANAQILVDADDSSKVQLVLNGLDITCESGPCINISGGDKVFITLAQGSSNSLSDGSGFTLSEDSDEANATIYSSSDLALNGSGSLDIQAGTKHGINSKDDLVITGGSYAITASGDALRGKDCVKIKEGSFSLDAGSDGIVSSNDSEEDRGFVSIDGGSLDITAGDDGVQAARYIRAAGGTIRVSAADDAFHSDRDLAIDGADISIDAGDDAVHGEYNVQVASGTLDVSSCYEGVEGQSVLISGGKNVIYAKDDAVNAAAASNESSDESPAESEGGRGQKPPTGMEEGGFNSIGNITISGGYSVLVCTQDGDSLDSNGSLTMTGGVVLISGCTGNDNGALDYDSSASISGGSILALGSPGMAQSFGSDSSQASVVTSLDNATAGSLVSITDDSGRVLLSYRAENDFSWILASSPAIEEGGSYHVCIGGTASDADEYGFSEDGSLSDAQDVATVQASTQAQGNMGMGGMHGGGGMDGGHMQGGPEGSGGDFNGEDPSGFNGQPPEAPAGEMPGMESSSAA